MSSRVATFHHSEFADLPALLEAKGSQTVSLCIPTLNEEDTIGDIVRGLKAELSERCALLDEIVVVDSGSTDRTREVAAAAGAEVHEASKILPHYGKARGKGENIWKAGMQLRGDILCFIDGDVRNMHPRFVYGPLGILLTHPEYLYAKGFYDRPHPAVETGVSPVGGGRVTEALVRPLFSLFFPDLAGFVQPLAGECAIRREVLEQIPMPTGYGVETAQVIDIYTRWGESAMAQCDLDERLHRHQDTGSLGRMSFAILHAFWARLKVRGVVPDCMDLPSSYRHFVRNEGVMELREYDLPDTERPPLIEIPEYRARHGK